MQTLFPRIVTNELILVCTLAFLASVALIIGAVLASSDYSSAGAFSIASACVGVIGTLAAQRVSHNHNDE